MITLCSRTRMGQAHLRGPARPTSLAAVAVAAAFLCTCPLAHGGTVTLTPVTITTPTFSGTIVINGTVTMGVGETMYSPPVQSDHYFPFLPTFTAGFNGPGTQFDPAFVAWNGIGSYNGPILNYQISPGNTGYSGGMPLGLYGANILGPGGNSGIRLYFFNAAGPDGSMTATHAIQVVPTPGAAALLGLSGLIAGGARRRRRAV